MTSTASPRLRKRDWVRFQLKTDRRVLEGFVQQLDESTRKIRIGKTPDTSENAWFALADMEILHHQPRS